MVVAVGIGCRKARARTPQPGGAEIRDEAVGDRRAEAVALEGGAGIARQLRHGSRDLVEENLGTRLVAVEMGDEAARQRPVEVLVADEGLGHGARGRKIAGHVGGDELVEVVPGRPAGIVLDRSVEEREPLRIAPEPDVAPSSATRSELYGFRAIDRWPSLSAASVSRRA